MPTRQSPAEEWFALTTSGLDALARDSAREAAALWIKAAGIALGDGLSKAQKAAAQNNAGVAHLINAEERGALICFKQARLHWAHAQRLLHAEPPVAAAASSVFHLRLAMEHHDTFAKLRQKRSVRFCRMARAITALNRCNAVPAAPRKAHLTLLATVLSDMLGSRCAPLDILAEYALSAAATSASTAAYRQQLLSVMHLRERQSPASGGGIELAARLTVLMSPQLRCTLPGSRAVAAIVERS